MLDCDLLESLFSLIGEKGRIVPEKYERFVNEKAGSASMEIFCTAGVPVYTGAVPEGKAGGEFCAELEKCRRKLWEALHPYSLKLLCLSPAQFIHFGTTRELLHLVTEDIDNMSFWTGSARCWAWRRKKVPAPAAAVILSGLRRWRLLPI